MVILKALLYAVIHTILIALFFFFGLFFLIFIGKKLCKTNESFKEELHSYCENAFFLIRDHVRAVISVTLFFIGLVTVLRLLPI